MTWDMLALGSAIDDDLHRSILVNSDYSNVICYGNILRGRFATLGLAAKYSTQRRLTFPRVINKVLSSQVNFLKEDLSGPAERDWGFAAVLYFVGLAQRFSSCQFAADRKPFSIRKLWALLPLQK
jgi:hypothetical protein